ncbi:MAG: mechanosensitive ion channel family protein [Bacteroidales bacterium]|nr:mechanosensitive ion channel family protein [Bacteroidales bacterium]
MKLLQDLTPLLLQGQAKADTAGVPDPFTQKKQLADSIAQSVRDSLAHLDASQMKDVITGENTIVKDALKSLMNMTLEFIPRLLAALLILWVGFKLAKIIKKSLLRLLERRGAEASLKSFLGSFVDVLLRVLVIIVAMDVIGIKATSFIAVLGAMGLAVGMALQGTLQNFAGGVIILLMKPFKVGDYIECGNFKGYVKEIRIFHTFIRPFNGRIIIVPNSELSNKSLINHTREPQIRMTVNASVAYGTDLQKAKDVLMSIVAEDELIQDTPKPPKVFVSDLGDSSVVLSMWLWINVDDYWTVDGYIREKVYNALYENDIEIPFPQVQVHGVPQVQVQGVPQVQVQGGK